MVADPGPDMEVVL